MASSDVDDSQDEGKVFGEPARSLIRYNPATLHSRHCFTLLLHTHVMLIQGSIIVIARNLVEFAGGVWGVSRCPMSCDKRKHVLDPSAAPLLVLRLRWFHCYTICLVLCSALPSLVSICLYKSTKHSQGCCVVAPMHAL